MKNVKKLFVLFVFSCFITNVNASPANDSFIDDNLYKCVIDAYNIDKEDKKDYTYSILPEELNTITTLDCSNYKGSIEDLTGLNTLRGLTSLNLSGNTFLGGSLKITGDYGTLKTSINLPSTLSLTAISYEIQDKNIIKIENNKVYPLDNGSTTVIMTAKVSGNEIKEKYLVSVSNPKFNKSSNAKLASLYLSKGEFAFDSDTTSYTVVVDKDTTSVKVNANVLDKTASFVNNYGPRTVELKEGTNEILVKVKAQDSSIKTYTINVIRSDGNDLNTRLINIELSIGEIDFKPDVHVYSVNVDSNIDNIDVKAVTESSLAEAKVSDTKLKVGINKITITVTSESGGVGVYELLVTREDYDSLDNYLSSINIKDYNITFNRNKFNYDLTIGFEKELSITPVLENKESSYEIVGNSDLKNNSKITIKVSDKEGSTREYVINIKKNSILDIIDYRLVILGIEFIIIFILILILIFRKPNKPRKPKKVKKPKRSNTPQPKVSQNVCKACGTVNDMKSKTCYVCGNLLK